MNEIADRWLQGVKQLENFVDVDPNRRGGKPCLKNTRMTVAQIIAQIAEGDSVDDLVEDMELDRDTLVGLLEGLAVVLEKSGSAPRATQQ